MLVSSYLEPAFEAAGAIQGDAGGEGGRARGRAGVRATWLGRSPTSSAGHVCCSSFLMRRDEVRVPAAVALVLRDTGQGAAWLGGVAPSGPMRKLEVVWTPPLSVLGSAEWTLFLPVPGSTHSPRSPTAEQGFTAPGRWRFGCGPALQGPGQTALSGTKHGNSGPVTELLFSNKTHSSYWVF